MSARKFTRITPSSYKEIARLLLNGFRKDEISLMLNFHPGAFSTFTNSTQYDVVRAAVCWQKDQLIERVKKARSGKLGYLCWYLERRFPKQFAKPEFQLTLGGSMTSNTLVVTTEVAEKLVNRSKEVNSVLNDLIHSRKVQIDGHSDVLKANQQTDAQEADQDGL